MLGTIKNIKVQNGFGFITPEEGNEDLFFHFTDLDGGIDTFNELEVDQKVEFDITDGRKPGKKQASNVKLA